MNRIFDPNNFFFSLLARCVDVVGLSMLWVLLCIPVVTIGPASAALYHAVSLTFRGEGSDGAFLLFFRSLRANLKQGVLVTLILVPVALFLMGMYGIYSLALSAGLPAASAAYVFFLVLCIIPVGLVCWLFPLLGRFEFTIPGLFSTALRLLVAHLPTTVVLVALMVALYSLATYLLILIFVAPALWAALATPLLERAFSRHMPPPDQE